jgi:G:T-mismatch repair DNA endonuclease (very short patch repair protein)
MYFLILLNNLNPCLNCNFHLKGIKKNVLNNASDFNFLSWIGNAYIYAWQCSL